jgi:hypothetical protein
MIKGQGTIFDPAEGVKFITFYVMGPDHHIVKKYEGNYWCTLDEWPEFVSQNWYLTADGGLVPSNASTADSVRAAAHTRASSTM